MLEGCYECLRVFLKQFGEEQSLLGDKSVYTLVKRGCEHDSGRKTSVRGGCIRCSSILSSEAKFYRILFVAALRVIGECFSLFGDHIYDEYEFWYFKLSEDLSCTNKADYVVALNILDVFYSNMAKLLASKGDEKSKEVLKVA